MFFPLFLSLLGGLGLAGASSGGSRNISRNDLDKALEPPAPVPPLVENVEDTPEEPAEPVVAPAEDAGPVEGVIEEPVVVEAPVDPEPAPEDVPENPAEPVETPEPIEGTIEDVVGQPAEPVTPPLENVEPPEDVAEDVPSAPPASAGAPEPDAPAVEPVVLQDGLAAEIVSGRVTTLSLPDGVDAASVRIVDLPEHGNVTVNPDGTLAAVMTSSDYVGAQSFTYEVTDSDGVISLYEAQLDVVPGTQDKGWGLGEAQYMLETDANDTVIVETGENHRKVYVSESDDALSREDIAALEALDVTDITVDWLIENPDYGGSEGMALKADVGMELWYDITGGTVEPNSNWLLFERGYEYDGIGRLVQRGTQGESELHPVHITSWGEGERPIIDDRVEIINQKDNINLVFSDLVIAEGVLGLSGENWLFENVEFTDERVVIQYADGVTIRNSEFIDIYNEAPVNPDLGWWDLSGNRISCIYIGDGSEGILLENNLFDYNGWREGYDPNGGIGSVAPPTMFSHNVYVQYNISDVTFRDNISMQAASYGAQLRSGAFVEDNLFVDNNIGFNVLGGDFNDAGPVGNYSLLNNNIVTSAGFKEAWEVGALAWGGLNKGQDTTLIDTIIAHMADPNNPDDIAAKDYNGQFTPALQNTQDPYYDNTIVYNWADDPDQGVDGLNPAALDEVTIQNFTAELLGDPNATVSDLADYLRARADGEFDDMVDADLINAFFREGFGLDTTIRGEADILTFVPDDRGEGMRWDNRLNWDSGDLPGTQDGDAVNLNGNWVQYGGTTTLSGFSFGDGGQLWVDHGKLTVDGPMIAGDRGGVLDIEGAGQVWINDYKDSDGLDIDVSGGRFANTGDMRGAFDLTADGGQIILADDDASFAVTDGSRLEIVGEDAKVGFDGSDGGNAVLALDEGGMLAFTAEAGEDLGTISEFRSGAYGETPDVASGVDLGNGTLQLDLTDLTDEAVQLALIEVDELVGSLDTVDVIGLGDRDIELIVDYIADKVEVQISAGTGQISTQTVGDVSDVSDGNEAFWAALTAAQGTYDENLPLPEDDIDTLEEAA